MRIWFLAIVLTLLGVQSIAQKNDVIRVVLPWQDKQVESPFVNGQIFTAQTKNGNSTLFHGTVPFYATSLDRYSLSDLKTEIVNDANTITDEILGDDFVLKAEISEVRGQYSLHYTVHPRRKLPDGRVERLLSFHLLTEVSAIKNSGARGPENTFTSILSSGDIFKLSVDKTGVYKIDKSFLESKFGINVSGINPKKIRIFGGDSGRLPEHNSIPRVDDLKELAIFVAGESDNRFDNSDYILFYAQGADKWGFDPKSDTYTYDKNIYDDKNYYYLKVDAQDGLRIRKSTIPSSPAESEYPYYDMLQRLEDDKINLLGSENGAEGTGKEWYGDELSGSSREKNYTSRFDFTSFVQEIPVSIEMIFAGRSENTTSVSLTFEKKVFIKNIQGVSTGDPEGVYARKTSIKEETVISEPNPQIKLNYMQTSSDSKGWIDYLQIVNGRELVFNNTQLSFRNKRTKQFRTVSLTPKAIISQIIWDVTDPFSPEEMALTSGKLLYNTGGLVREFVAHNNLNGAFEPIGLGKIPNQNLHAMKDEDMVIVTHPKFLPEAQRLAEHRKKHSGLKVMTVTTDQVYNEFSGGKTDPAAIRDMARMLLNRNPSFRYLLLFGDGSYDYKGLVKEIPAENFVPAYETDESLDPIDGFPSDDFYGLLGNDEGFDLRGGLDIYVGRLPAKSTEEAAALVNKIIHYETSSASFGDWKLNAGYVADDEDGNTHLRDMDEIANDDENRHKLIHQQKVYADAFRQVPTAGENRYPDANKKINDNIFKGQLSVTYLGHGGPLGWAQERILTVPDLQSMANIDKLAVMVTATCSFAAYDDPSIVTPAEYAILNPKGGAIALLSTTRAVYTNSNKILTDGVHQLMFSKINNQAPSLGYVLAEGKNKSQGDFFRINSRKFTLLGDPALKVALPEKEIITTRINSKDAIGMPDTLSALEKVALEGVIKNGKGEIDDSFNGTLFVTVYDKKSTLQTLSNDSGSPKFSFKAYTNILFKGTATVKSGKWIISFWMPKNINYTFGNARVTYYAHDGKSDAAGIFTNVIVGGANSALVADDQSPQMDAFINDESFVSGGITNENPVLILNLKDDFGINVTGNAVGQDITAVLDGNNQNIFVLNEFYESTKDDFSKGQVKFPLNKLSKGNHFIVAKAWDISGNSTEKRIDFVVTDVNDNALKNVYNYPNPFSTLTHFQFEHNMTNTDLDIIVDIYTISGKLIKSIVQTKYSSGFRVNDIGWNGRDDFDGSLARGVYLYKIRIHSKELKITKESGFEKLVKL